MLRKRFARAVVPLALLASVAPAAARAGGPTLVVLGSDTLDVTGTPHASTATAFVSVFNRGNDPATLTVSFAASSAAGVSVEKSPVPNTVQPGDAKRVKVTFTGLTSLTSVVDGELIVHGGAAPVAKSVSITPAPQPAHLWARDFILGSLILAGLGFVVTAIWACVRCSGRLTMAAPGPKWEFGGSWATNLTAVGATLGTVLGAATLPAVPSQIDKETLVRLNLGFGLLVVVAPFLFQAVRAPNRKRAVDDDGLYGWNITLLAACSLTYAAVLGELATLALLFWELLRGGSYGVAVVVATGAAGALVAWYFIATVPFAATTDWSKTGGDQAVTQHGDWLAAALARIRDGRELAGGTAERIGAAPTADEFEEAMRATAPAIAVSSQPVHWRLP